MYDQRDPLRAQRDPAPQWGTPAQFEVPVVALDLLPPLQGPDYGTTQWVRDDSVRGRHGLGSADGEPLPVPPLEKPSSVVRFVDDVTEKPGELVCDDGVRPTGEPFQIASRRDEMNGCLVGSRRERL